MREDTFRPVSDRFFEYFQQEGKRLDAEFEGVICRVYEHYPPDDDPGYGHYALYISCLLAKTTFDAADSLSLGILAYDRDEKPTVNTEISWGHPGIMEDELFDKPVEMNEESLARIKNELPRLVLKLEELLRKYPLGRIDPDNPER